MESKALRKLACRLLSSALVLAAISSVAVAQPQSTALENLLVAFANQQTLADYRSIDGVNWRIFSVPSEPKQSFEWAGALRLAGFGDVTVPRGVGIDNQAVKANEGDARLSVQGDTTRGVSQITAVKHRATADYASMLQAQLSSGGKVTLLASNCRANSLVEGPDAASTAFYRLDLAQVDAPVYAEVSRDSVGNRNSPGSTTLVFRKQGLEPILYEDMECTLPSGD